jgi:S1-C subfamily serine protease
VSTDLSRDLALLAPDLPIPPLEMEPAGQQRQGDELLVLGYPRPSELGVGGQPTLTRGLLSAIRQEAGVTKVQTDATVNPGNSGGPVLNMRGHLIGVISYRLKDSVGLNFAIGTESIEAFLAAPAAIQSPPAPTPNSPVASATTPTPTPAPSPAPTLPPQPSLKPQYQTKNGLQTIDSMFWQLQKLGYRGPTDDASILAAFAKATGAPVTPTGTFADY